MLSKRLRQTVLAPARRVVVKLGTQLLTREEGGIDQRYLNAIARQIYELRKRKIEITLVASGAIGEGCDELDLPKRPKDVADLQAVAAVGQPRLMVHLHRAFSKHGLTPAQLLLTRGDFEDRLRFLNIRNCVMRLHRFGCVPIINENDTVAVEELEALRVGENDTLAAMICNALRADALFLLTVVDGLEDERGQRVDLVDNVPQAMAMVRRDQTRSGKGGMSTKLQAAHLVTGAGEIAVIANGRLHNVLLRLFNGEAIGTVFVPASRKLDSRSRWIALTKRPAGTITIDSGAVAALTHRGKSLLAIGITGLTGRFERGEVVMVRDSRGRQIARGLTNYCTDDLRLIMGKRSTQFEKILGRPAFAEIVHRDNLIMMESEH
jgi:glutamate 5-kinase